MRYATYFAACMGQQGLPASSICTYLSGIHQLQIASGHSDPHIDHMPRLRQILKGIKVQAAQSGKTSHSHLPITPSILRKLKSIWIDGDPSFGDLANALGSFSYKIFHFLQTRGNNRKGK